MLVSFGKVQVGRGIYRVVFPIIELKRQSLLSVEEKISSGIQYLIDKLRSMVGIDVQVGVFQKPTISSTGEIQKPEDQYAIYWGEDFEKDFFSEGSQMPAYWLPNAVGAFGKTPETVTHIGFYAVFPEDTELQTAENITLNIPDNSDSMPTVTQAPAPVEMQEEQMYGWTRRRGQLGNFANKIAVGVGIIALGFLIGGIAKIILVAIGIAWIASLVIRPIVDFVGKMTEKTKKIIKDKIGDTGSLVAAILIVGLLGFVGYKMLESKQ